MRYAAGHKEKTRLKIVRAAGKVFRREGYHAAGVDKVMEEAGLTSGGFYAHFASKEALLAVALEPAAAEVGARRDKELEGTSSRASVQAFIEGYLSPGHMRNTEEGCPLPALASDVARAGRTAREGFEAVVRRFAARNRRPVRRRLGRCPSGQGRRFGRTDPCFMSRFGPGGSGRRY
jgi:TetR/AcrR family transcriptional repressor of nem operon